MTKQVSISDKAYYLALQESTRRKLSTKGEFISSKQKTIAYVISSIIEKELGHGDEQQND